MELSNNTVDSKSAVEDFCSFEEVTFVSSSKIWIDYHWISQVFLQIPHLLGLLLCIFLCGVYDHTFCKERSANIIIDWNIKQNTFKVVFCEVSIY